MATKKRVGSDKSKSDWQICDNCLDPLADHLLNFANRFNRSFDVAKAVRLDAEYRQTQEDSAYNDDRLSETQRRRQDELLEQIRKQSQPPCSRDLNLLYRKYRVKHATDWLKINLSVDYANEFDRVLSDVKNRFAKLEFKASQIINGDYGRETTILVRYSIRRLKDRHDELLREKFPDERPDREEMPDEMQAFEINILDEYVGIENQVREAGYHLQRVSDLIREKTGIAKELDKEKIRFHRRQIYLIWEEHKEPINVRLEKCKLHLTALNKEPSKNNAQDIHRSEKKRKENRDSHE